MICNMVRCDFCGKTEEFKITKKNPMTNSNASPFETHNWFSVNPLKMDDSLDFGNDTEHLCRECYERMKKYKRMTSISSPTGGAK